MAEKKFYLICDDDCRVEGMSKEQILAAIEQAAKNGLVFDTEAAFITKVKEGNKGSFLKFWLGTQAEYNALIARGEKDPQCYYIFTDCDSTAELTDKVKYLQNELSTLTAEDVGARPNTWLPTIDEIGAAPAGYGYGDMPTLCGPADDDSSFVEILSYQFSLIPNKTKQIIFTRSGVSYLGTLWNAGNNYGTLVANSYVEPNVAFHFHQLVRVYKDGDWQEWVNFSPSAFVPSGYGLGEVTPKKVSSADDALATGWYQLPATSTAVSWLYCASYSENIKRQEWYTANNHKVRYMSKGVWQSWEWVNPPMILKTEYRTTERWNGKPVYTVAIDFGALPNDNGKTVTGVINAAAKDIRIVDGSATNNTTGISKPLFDLNLDVQAVDNGTSKGYVSIRTYEDLTAWNARIILKYVV